MPFNRDHVAEIEDLYRQHGAALLLFAESLVGERSRAQDAIHQVFVRFLEQDRLLAVTDRKAYLFTCVRNNVLNDLKVRQRNVEISETEPWFEPPERDHVGEVSLRRALLALPDDQRQIVVLHIWAELTFSQIEQSSSSTLTLPHLDTDTHFPN